MAISLQAMLDICMTFGRCGGRKKENKTGVINDPLGQLQNQASKPYFRLNISLIFVIFDLRMYRHVLM